MSCPSANRMLCAGERHEIRTERETLRKKKDKKKRQPKKAEDSICSKEKTAMRQVIRRWSDPSRGRRREQQYSYSISGIGQILYRK